MAKHWATHVATAGLLAGVLGLTGCGGAPEPERVAEPPAGGLVFPLERTEARLARGEYLATAVALCLECHSQSDFDAPGAPLIPGSEAGGEVFPMADMPGRVVASNISPDKETGAGDWSDEDFYKALTQGVGHDGRTLFPLMPYANYRKLSDEDLASIIVYIRSLPAVRHELEPTELIEPVKASLQPLPPRESIPDSDPSDPVRHGAYLANAALCGICHTPPQPNGAPQENMAYAGGWLMEGPWGAITPANITPDASGIEYYDEATFVDMMHTGKVKARELSVLMPVRFFKHMTDDDIKALFAYLRTLTPVAHRVDNTEEPAPCKKCGFPHGLGAMNE